VVHSIELLLDSDTESAVRRMWKEASGAGLRAPGPTSRPHATLIVADGISTDADQDLRPLLRHLPVSCVIGAPMVFGREPFTLVRSVVPSTELLDLHAEAMRVCAEYLSPGPAPNTAVGQWTPHVTLARRVDQAQLGSALRIRAVTRDLAGGFVGLRHWDGNHRAEHLIE
jgi:2'-5' RNA ligase superfamily